MEDREVENLARRIAQEERKITSPRHFWRHEAIRLVHEISFVTAAGLVAEHVVIPTLTHASVAILG